MLYRYRSHKGIEHCHNNVKVTGEVEGGLKTALANGQADHKFKANRQSLPSSLVVTGMCVCVYLPVILVL